jgi:hypothetical protein
MILLYYPIHPTPKAFGGDDGLDLVPSPVPDMVTSTKPYWVNLAEHRSSPN